MNSKVASKSVEDYDKSVSAFKSNVGDYLARRRAWIGFNQKTAAESIGVTTMSITRIERGDNVRLDVWLKYMDFLGVLDRLNKEFSPEDYGYGSRHYYPSNRSKHKSKGGSTT